MREIRTLARLGRAAREEAAIKVRQPLSRMVCVVPQRSPATSVAVRPARGRAERQARGPRVIGGFARDARRETELPVAWVRSSAKTRHSRRRPSPRFTSDELRAFEHGQPLAVSVGNDARTLDHDDLSNLRRATGALTVKEEDGRFAAIDPTITPELRREGIARELVSQLQRLRRDLGFAVSDRIRVWIAAPAETYERRSASTLVGSPMNSSPGRSLRERPRPVNRCTTLDLDGSTVRARPFQGTVAMASASGGSAKKAKPMNKKNLQHFEKRLLEERRRVLKELGPL